MINVKINIPPLTRVTCNLFTTIRRYKNESIILKNRSYYHSFPFISKLHEYLPENMFILNPKERRKIFFKDYPSRKEIFRTFLEII